MITFKEAYKKVLENPLDLGTEYVPLLNGLGRILAEPIMADRDFPPFNRATKDGIAIQYETWKNGTTKFRIEGIASAGMQQQKLMDASACFEVMTGAVVPENTDTVIMYEHVSISDGWAVINEKIEKNQNIHYQGSDVTQGTQILEVGIKITPAEIGVLASVGKPVVQVKTLPKVCAIATGNELVDIDKIPEPHQIRKSNSTTLQAALAQQNIVAHSLHLMDDRKSIELGLKKALSENDVLLLSGGVSKGKFDFIPGVMEELGVEKIFHRVAQRPGKPFWFGVHKESKTIIFSFPGNPVSTFANYHLYFLPWLHTSLGVSTHEQSVKLSKKIQIKPPLTRFIQVKTQWQENVLWATPVTENGSGDLTSLVKADGFICLEPRDKSYEVGELVKFVKAKE
ncbi:molybdopterin molybdotransferase MoeA [Maribacter sp. 2210JD10-5]|uniref:molybdopterin molybdotransferase MoeA n=1 Tax=Maribacter sp. 2210JD10-5 TaxID=3386272 RepID=UPI0039BD753E